MESLINLILQFGDLNKQQIEFLLSKVETLELKKDDYLSEAGKVPRYVAFVLEGVFRFCYYNNRGEEITNYFVDEGNFVVDNQKFESQIVASEYVQAVTDCKVLVFNKKSWDEISDTIVGWEMMKANMVKKCLTLAMSVAVRWFQRTRPHVICPSLRRSQIWLTASRFHTWHRTLASPSNRSAEYAVISANSAFCQMINVFLLPYSTFAYSLKTKKDGQKDCIDNRNK